MLRSPVWLGGFPPAMEKVRWLGRGEEMPVMEMREERGGSLESHQAAVGLGHHSW